MAIRELPYSTRREITAIDQATRVRIEPDGSVSVPSESQPHLRRRVTYTALDDGSIRFTCNGSITADGRLWTEPTCPAGLHYTGRDRVPCWHAAKAARYLEHSGLAVWRPVGDAGVWFVAGAFLREYDAAAALAAAAEAKLDPLRGLPR